MAKKSLKKDVPAAAPATAAPAPATAPDPAPVADPAAADTAADAADVADAGAAVDDALSNVGPSDADIRQLIAQCEQRATTGHGLDADRELLASAAQMLRALAGLDILEPVAPAPGPYGPVKHDPPIGHSLP